jgi:DNA-binding Xre family transcriptional regulator
MTVRLFLREIAEKQGFNMSTLQREARLPMSTMQRYWHGVGVTGEPLQSISLLHVDVLCEVLNCQVGDLLRKVSDPSPDA